ncbi:MAG TPA: hypothetical protein VK908_06060 [Jiangellales bacterium]|nr:hypothetical protein [Jiangellales bacterium]
MTIAPTTLTRGSGVAAVAAGLIFIGVQVGASADSTAVQTAVGDSRMTTAGAA